LHRYVSGKFRFDQQLRFGFVVGLNIDLHDGARDAIPILQSHLIGSRTHSQ
jgi:hypothetical protein